MGSVPRDLPTTGLLPEAAQSRGFQLAGRRTSLRVVAHSDYDWLYEAATAPSALHDWRLRGATPSPNQFIQQLWEGVLFQFVVESHDGRPLGLAQIYNYDSKNAHACISVLMSAEVQGLGWPLEGPLLTLRYAFDQWPFRKIYLEGIATSLEKFASSSNDLWQEEGRLLAHEYYRGSFVDYITYAVYRDVFSQIWDDRLSALFSPLSDAPANP